MVFTARDEDGKIQHPGLYHPPDCPKCGEKQSALIHEGEAYDYCSNCGEEPPGFSEPKPTCVACGERESQLNHHTSYLFNITVRVCRTCHTIIHMDDDRFEELQPNMGRMEAHERGWFDHAQN